MNGFPTKDIELLVNLCTINLMDTNNLSFQERRKLAEAQLNNQLGQPSKPKAPATPRKFGGKTPAKAPANTTKPAAAKQKAEAKTPAQIRALPTLPKKPSASPAKPKAPADPVKSSSPQEAGEKAMKWLLAEIDQTMAAMEKTTRGSDAYNKLKQEINRLLAIAKQGPEAAQNEKSRIIEEMHKEKVRLLNQVAVKNIKEHGESARK